ncbi:LLM class flavin-dependent oxidoreductase [Aeromicrobium wangtongii]|uniref:LLM class flavin-dependent oxidoreductase n=1 Tax=Aeromicrobium wangtongii TaxID=2969247 RepID=UPI002016A958|nr:LLM class flavin-dependent oxidoreductase [Aeromicrobium wangtongii]MCL3820032.1 LLM class flavin-dependent oxidoreductase [Aeromicrobium wangtongii]
MSIDYRHDLLFGSFVTPTAHDPQHTVDLAVTSERAGLDLVTFQDHPYQPAFLDTWTLMSYVAARTERIALSGNVLNLPLRPPAVLAQAATSLDLLSGGRFELGLGAGAFWDAVDAMGGRRLTPGQAVDALAEAIEVIRQLWDTEQRDRTHLDGEYYRLRGAKRGPRAAHPINIWVGAYKPRMLALVGRAADGWLPSINYLDGGPAALPELNERIDDAAQAAGRRPADIRRLLNFATPRFSQSSAGLLNGPAGSWVDQLSALALEHGISGFIIASDDPRTIEQYAAEVAPAVREIVARERA